MSYKLIYVLVIVILLTIFMVLKVSYGRNNKNSLRPAPDYRVEKNKNITSQNANYKQSFSIEDGGVVVFPDFTLSLDHTYYPTKEEYEAFEKKNKGMTGPIFGPTYNFEVKDLKDNIQKFEMGSAPFSWNSFKVDNQNYTLAVYNMHDFVVVKGSIDDQRAWEKLQH